MTTSSKPHKSVTATRWTNAKKFKITGSALLLIAFWIQMYQTKVSDRESTKLESAELDGRQHIKALEYENLYFSVKAATGADDPSNLRNAAIERAVGRSALVVTSDETRDVKISHSNELMQAANRVNDLQSFNDFMGTLQEEVDASTFETDALILTERKADLLWWSFVCLYVIGSFCLLGSQYSEKNPTE